MRRVYRLLISDVDGTLVTTEKVLTAGSIDAVARLHEAGVLFAVVSSRPPRGMAMLVEPLQITTALAGFNGGAIVLPDQTPVEERDVPQPAVETALAAFSRAGVDTWVFADGEWLLTNPDGAYVPRERRTVQFEPRIVSDFAPYVGRAGKVVGSTRDFDLLARVEKELQVELGRRRGGASVAAILSRRDASRRQQGNGGARNFRACSDVPLEETACIGDMGNDVPMLDIAGLAIAMGNAPPDVQAHAHEVTASNEADGFAMAVDRFVLPRVHG